MNGKDEFAFRRISLVFGIAVLTTQTGIVVAADLTTASYYGFQGVIGNKRFPEFNGLGEQPSLPKNSYSVSPVCSLSGFGQSLFQFPA